MEATKLILKVRGPVDSLLNFQETGWEFCANPEIAARLINIKKNTDLIHTSYRVKAILELLNSITIKSDGCPLYYPLYLAFVISTMDFNL